MNNIDSMNKLRHEIAVSAKNLQQLLSLHYKENDYVINLGLCEDIANKKNSELFDGYDPSFRISDRVIKTSRFDDDIEAKIERLCDNKDYKYGALYMKNQANTEDFYDRRFSQNDPDYFNEEDLTNWTEKEEMIELTNRIQNLMHQLSVLEKKNRIKNGILKYSSHLQKNSSGLFWENEDKSFSYIDNNLIQLFEDRNIIQISFDSLNNYLHSQEKESAGPEI